MSLEDATLAKIFRRLVSFVFVLFILNSIDRVNVSFAALQMNADLGFTPRQYGFGVGIFFVTYLAFQIPSALLGRRFGVRAWLGGMLIVWGLAASGLGFVDGIEGFTVLRLVLGLAEAGFAPLTLYYYGAWIPGRFRGRATSRNVVAIAVSIAIGASVSGWLMSVFDQVLGHAGWRWMFVLEGLPTVLLGIFTLVYLPNRPEEARWLSAAERDWLVAELAKEQRETQRHGVSSLGAMFASPRLWACAGTWFSLTLGVYGVIFWLPQAIKLLAPGLGPLAVGLLTAIPWVAAAFAMVWNARHSDRSGRRIGRVVVPSLIGAAGLAASVAVGGGPAAYALLIVGLMGLGAAQAVYWTIPMGFLAGPAAAGGLALINLIGNSAGLIGPNVIGWIRASTGSFSAAGYLLAGFLVLGAACLLPLWRDRAAPSPAPARGWPMPDIEALLRPFRQAHAARLGPAPAGAIGVAAVGAPVELVVAAGLVPWRLFPDPSQPTPLADEFMEPVFDGAVRSVFDRFLRGDFASLGAAIVPRFSESWLQLYYFLQQVAGERPDAPLPPLHLFDLLKTPHWSTRRYVRDELVVCQGFLETLAGRTIDEASLADAIALVDRQREALGAVDALRRLDAPRLSGSEVATIVAAAGVMAPAAHLAALEALLDGAAALPPRPASARIMVKGSAPGDLGFYELVESCGAAIVADDHADGTGPWEGRVAADGVPPLDALARHYHRSVSTARSLPQEAEDERFLQRAEDARVDGVLFVIEEHDDTLGWDLPAQRRALDRRGVASLVLLRQPYRAPDRDAQRAALVPWLASLAEASR